MTANATHPGRITIPGTAIGIAGTLIAEPQTKDMLIALDDRLVIGPVKIDTDLDGNLQAPGLVVPIVSNVLWELRFEPRNGMASFVLGIFNLNTSGVNLKDLVSTTVSVYDPSFSPTDAAVASAITSGPATKAALTRTGSQPVGQDEIVLNAADYGIVGDTTTQSLTALNAAITAGAARFAVAVYFPAAPGGYYAFNQPFPNVSNVRIYGDSMGTVLRWTSGSMLAPTGTLTGWSFESIGLENFGTANHLIELAGTSSLTHSSFRRVELKTRVTTTSILHMNGSGSLLNVRFWDCKLWRQAAHTVPAIDVQCSSTGCNGVAFFGGQWHSQGATVGPFARFESTGASGVYIGGLTFRDIIGEINMGGLIHCYGVNRVTVNNVVDFDSVGSYTDDLFKFDTAPTGTVRCQGLVFENSGTSGVGTFSAGKQHLYLGDAGTSHRVGRVVNSGSNYGLVRVPTNNLFMLHGGGVSWSYRTVTAGLTASAGDHYIVGNGSNITITLPDPAALLSGGNIPAGREYAVKNIHATALTVASAGTATIDGATTKVLTQNQSARYISDGTNWLAAGVSSSLSVTVLGTTSTAGNNSVTDTTLMTGLTIPAGALVAGQTLVRIRVYGNLDSIATPGAFNLRVKVGGTAVLTQALLTSTATSTNAATPWSTDLDLVVDATGAGGAVSIFGQVSAVTGATNTRVLNEISNVGTAVTLTTPLAITVTANTATANAGNIIRALRGSIQQIA